MKKDKDTVTNRVIIVLILIICIFLFLVAIYEAYSLYVVESVEKKDRGIAYYVFVPIFIFVTFKAVWIMFRSLISKKVRWRLLGISDPMYCNKCHYYLKGISRDSDSVCPECGESIHLTPGKEDE